MKSSTLRMRGISSEIVSEICIQTDGIISVTQYSLLCPQIISSPEHKLLYMVIHVLDFT